MVISYGLHANVACVSSDTGAGPNSKVTRVSCSHAYDLKVVFGLLCFALSVAECRC